MRAWIDARLRSISLDNIPRIEYTSLSAPKLLRSLAEPSLTIQTIDTYNKPASLIVSLYSYKS